MATIWFAKHEYWKSSTVVHQADPEHTHYPLCGAIGSEISEPIYFENPGERDFAIRLGVDPDTVSCKKCLKLIVKRTTKVESKRKVIWNKCTGDAHSNPWIDHCGICMPYWEDYPTCPTCGNKPVKKVKGLRPGKILYTLEISPVYWYWCKTCRKHLEG